MGRKLKKVGNFLKEHWVEITVAGVGIVGGVIVYKAWNANGISEKLKDKLLSGIDAAKSAIPKSYDFADAEKLKALNVIYADVPGEVCEQVMFKGEDKISVALSFADVPVEKLGEFGEKFMKHFENKSDAMGITTWIEYDK